MFNCASGLANTSGYRRSKAQAPACQVSGACSRIVLKSFTLGPLLSRLEPLRCCKVNVSFGSVADVEVGDSATVVSIGTIWIETDGLGKRAKEGSTVSAIT